MRRTLAALAAAAMLSVPMAATPSDVQAQPVVIGDSLVNVQIVGVRIIRDVAVADVVDVVAAANVCPNLNVDLAALAALVDQSGDTQRVNCDADARNDVVIRQNQ